jgi:TonB family protein
MPLRKLVAVLLVLFPGLCLGKSDGITESQNTVILREHRVWSSPKRETEFATIGHTSRSSCEATRPPEALATPSPLLDNPKANAKIKVSFIIGTDGRVHSPFILESAGPSDDQVVLDAVRTWRYRPATCNGVPTESEARIGFSGR